MHVLGRLALFTLVAANILSGCATPGRSAAVNQLITEARALNSEGFVDRILFAEVPRGSSNSYGVPQLSGPSLFCEGCSNPLGADGVIAVGFAVAMRNGPGIDGCILEVAKASGYYVGASDAYFLFVSSKADVSTRNDPSWLKVGNLHRGVTCFDLDELGANLPKEPIVSWMMAAPGFATFGQTNYRGTDVSGADFDAAWIAPTSRVPRPE